MPTLFVSTTSPYTRLLMMIAKSENIDLNLQFVLPLDNTPALLAVNPFGQVPALALADGTVITETPLIIHALAPQILTANTLPNLSKALGILFQGVRAYSLERLGQGNPPHAFIDRSLGFLNALLPTLPTLSADSQNWGDKALLCALNWIGFRLPAVFDTLSDDNKQAVLAFANSELMQKTTPEVLEKHPNSIADL